MIKTNLWAAWLNWWGCRFFWEENMNQLYIKDRSLSWIIIFFWKTSTMLSLTSLLTCPCPLSIFLLELLEPDTFSEMSEVEGDRHINIQAGRQRAHQRAHSSATGAKNEYYYWLVSAVGRSLWRPCPSSNGRFQATVFPSILRMWTKTRGRSVCFCSIVSIINHGCQWATMLYRSHSAAAPQVSYSWKIGKHI